ncbi:MAG: type II toxin-antitoxin system VapC family toxin [Treponema sp.]|nr:type II toxin-antitoxin system VapC family toxin [Treponema sp.]
MANRFKQADISALSGRTIFFDANVVIYLFWLVFSPENEKSYSSILKSLLLHKNQLAVDTGVLSEVINRILRYEWHLRAKKNSNFKVFRNTCDGMQAQKDVFDIIRNRILTSFKVIDTQRTSEDIKNMLVVDTLDFNDKIIYDICKTYNLVLLTHDADFSKSDIDILSANPKLVKNP